MEEQDTKVFVQKYGKIKNMDGKSYDFCSIHVNLQPYDPWEDENTSLANEGCKMKDNFEGDEFTSSFFLGDLKIIAKEDNVVNGAKSYFGSNTKEGHRSDLKSPFKLHNEAKYKHISVGFEPKYLV